MKLMELLADIGPVETAGNMDAEITGVQSDSRRVRRGDLFVAVRGEKADGCQFISDAISAGAAAVVCEETAGATLSVPHVRVSNARAALALLADCFHGRPSLRLKMAGVTGTNGKTTTSFLAASILEAAGIPTGVVGTVSYRFGSRELPAPNTTPGADELQELLAQMLQAGMKAVVMEASSHALTQHRTDGVAWDVAAFTNLTQDHLDYHKTMEAYFEAKKSLFLQLGTGGKKASAVLNRDDPRFEDLRQAAPAGVRILSYGFSPEADLRAEGSEATIRGCRFTLIDGGNRMEVSTPLCGAHNVSNSLAAAAMAMALGADLAAVARGIAAVASVPGRLQPVEIPAGPPRFSVFVDYAHTEDALRRVLGTLRPLTRGRLIAVFGCGGGRDRLKRPLMGRAVGELSDFSIVTSDNPRFEEPSAIVQEIVAGLGTRKNFRVTLDRREAIRGALAMAGDGDVVLLAGKGHETYQEIAGIRMPFDDRLVAREILESLRGASAREEATCKN